MKRIFTIFVFGAVGCVALSVACIGFEFTSSKLPTKDSELPRNWEDLSGSKTYQNIVAQWDKTIRECYVYRSEVGYELLFYQTDDRKHIATIPKGTKVKIVRIVRITERGRANILSDITIQTSRIIPLLDFEDSTKQPGAAFVLRSFMLLDKFHDTDNEDVKYKFRKDAPK